MCMYIRVFIFYPKQHTEWTCTFQDTMRTLCLYTKIENWLFKWEMLHEQLRENVYVKSTLKNRQRILKCTTIPCFLLGRIFPEYTKSIITECQIFLSTGNRIRKYGFEDVWLYTKWPNQDGVHERAHGNQMGMEPSQTLIFSSMK